MFVKRNPSFNNAINQTKKKKYRIHSSAGFFMPDILLSSLVAFKMQKNPTALPLEI